MYGGRLRESASVDHGSQRILATVAWVHIQSDESRCRPRSDPHVGGRPMLPPRTDQDLIRACLRVPFTGLDAGMFSKTFAMRDTATAGAVLRVMQWQHRPAESRVIESGVKATDRLGHCTGSSCPDS